MLSPYTKNISRGDNLNFLSGIIPIIIAIIVFGILVISHEFGHFFVAKKNGILVEEFSVGMGPAIISKRIGETLYSIRAIPFGGFCRMLGEDEETNDKRAFINKSPGARMAVIAAGPIMNFIVAFVLILGYNSLSGIITPVVSSLTEGGHAAESGLEIGDRITSINGQRVYIYNDISLIMDGCTGDDVEVGVKKADGSRETYTIEPSRSSDGRWLIGFSASLKSPLLGQTYDGYERASFYEIIHDSFFSIIFFIKSTVIGFIRILSFRVNPDEIAGPIGMVQIIGDSYTIGIKYSLRSAIFNIMYLSALFSANLGAINLFPIPAMDGGRLVFIIIEKLRGKPIDAEKEGFVHFIGFVVLMLFMVLIAYNDIRRIFF